MVDYIEFYHLEVKTNTIRLLVEESSELKYSLIIPMNKIESLYKEIEGEKFGFITVSGRIYISCLDYEPKYLSERDKLDYAFHTYLTSKD